MEHTEVSFFSDGDRIAGYLYTPDDWKPGDARRPGILVLAGYSGNTQADCTHMMKRLCAEGWFVLGYDYVGFGKSEGKRNRHRPLEQAQNTYDALSYMQTVDGIDPERLAIYGTSFGGANGVWVAAHDERVKVLVTSVGVMNGEEWMRRIRRPWEWLAFKERVLQEARSRVVTGQSTLYRSVIAPACRTCHLMRGTGGQSDIDFATFEKFQAFADRTRAHVVDKHGRWKISDHKCEIDFQNK